MSKWTPLALILTLFVASCTTTGQSDACAGFKPITGRKADAAVISDDLARSIYEHNEFVKRHCR